MLNQEIVLNMNEAKFTTKLQRWMRHHLAHTYAWEVKFLDLEKDKSLNLINKTFKNELHNLLVAIRGYFVYKFPDSAGFGTPCDGITLYKEPAYVFIQFYRRGTKHFYLIKAEVMDEFLEAGNKSINEEQALKLGTRYELK